MQALVVLVAVTILAAINAKTVAVIEQRHRNADKAYGKGVLKYSALRGDSQGGGADEPPPTCSCDCCTVARRRPDEFAAGAAIKCSPSEDHPDMCAEQCSIPEGDRVLNSEAVGDGLDYQRFCFFECKPAAGLTSAIGEQCLLLDAADTKSVVDKNGAASDPAFIYGNSPVQLPVNSGSSPTLVALTKERNVAAKAVQPAEEEVTAEGAIKAAVDGRYQAQTQATGAKSEAQETREHEAEMASGAGANANGFAAIDEIRLAVQRSQAAASRASANAANAVRAYKAARTLNWKTAIDTAASSVDELRVQVANEGVAMAQPPPGEAWRRKASVAAATASKPYLDSVRDAQQSVFEYNKRAGEEADEARALQAQATEMTKVANALNQAGKTEEANAKLSEARTVALHAQKISAWANDLYKTAGTTAGKIDLYYRLAQQAAKKAGSEVMR